MKKSKYWCIVKPSDPDRPRRSPLLFMTCCPDNCICWTYHYSKAMVFPLKYMAQAFAPSGSGFRVYSYDERYLRMFVASRDPIPLEFR